MHNLRAISCGISLKLAQATIESISSEMKSINAWTYDESLIHFDQLAKSLYFLFYPQQLFAPKYACQIYPKSHRLRGIGLRQFKNAFADFNYLPADRHKLFVVHQVWVSGDLVCLFDRPDEFGAQGGIYFVKENRHLNLCRQNLFRYLQTMPRLPHKKSERKLFRFLHTKDKLPFCFDLAHKCREV